MITALIEGQIYVAAQDIKTNMWFIPKGTRLVYETQDHNLQYDVFFHRFHLLNDPARVLGLRSDEIGKKLEGMTLFQGNPDEVQSSIT